MFSPDALLASVSPQGNNHRTPVSIQPFRALVNGSFLAAELKSNGHSARQRLIITTMTLLVTEIHNHNDPAKAAIVFAADRLITVRGHFKELRKKIYPVPRHRSAIGYFGIAEAAGKSMSEWLTTYIHRDRSASLQEFAEGLANALNVAVPQARRTSEVSGFHLCGFSNDLVQFWFVRNVDDQLRPVGAYSAREEFQQRDVHQLPPHAAKIYRNGDIEAHVRLWSDLDKNLAPLLSRNDFKRVRTTTDYAQWVRFKMEVTAYIYKKWCRLPVIGRPIDMLLVTRGHGPRVV